MNSFTTTKLINYTKGRSYRPVQTYHRSVQARMSGSWSVAVSSAARQVAHTGQQDDNGPIHADRDDARGEGSFRQVTANASFPLAMRRHLGKRITQFEITISDVLCILSCVLFQKGTLIGKV